MRQYSIWHNVQACHYKSDKSYGGKDNSEDLIVVGSGARNSHELANTVTIRRFFKHEKFGAVCCFMYKVDGVVLKELIFEDDNGKAGKLLHSRTALKRIKGLS